MNAIANSWMITKHSFAVLRQRKTLLLLPLIWQVISLSVFFGVTLPVVFGVTVGEIATAIGNSEWASAAWEQRWGDGSNPAAILSPDFSAVEGIAVYLLSIFVPTFLCVVSTSEVLHALNGGNVSIGRGFRFAFSRFTSIVAWTLVSGTIGLAVRFVVALVPPAARWVAALIGIGGWSLATLFVVPVLIRERETRNPLQYLRISADLIRRTWGEGMIAIVGGPLLVAVPAGISIALLLGFVIGAIVKALTAVSFLSDVAAVALILGLLIIPVAAYLIGAVIIMLYQVFRTALYVFAAEGVAPGEFSAADFDKAWRVRNDSRT